MRNLFFAALLLCAVLENGAAFPSPPVRYRPAETLAESSSWELAGNILVSSLGTRAAYLPLRRRADGAKWDEGCIRKVWLDGVTPGETAWQSETQLPRSVLRPVFEDGAAVSGTAVSMGDFDADVADACGLDEDSWPTAADMMNSKAMGAPYPAAMALAEGTLYVLCDDGVLCALSASTGAELWNFLLPQACVRLSSALEAARDGLPWMSAGSLTAEESGDGRTLIWGTLGEAGRGLFCVDVSGTTPSLVWALEDQDGSSGLGLTDAAPLLVSLSGDLTLITPSGKDAEGAMMLYDALSGDLLDAAEASDDTELILSPVGLTSDDALSAVVCCDSDGGAQYFTCADGKLTANFRVDFENICGLGELKFSFSPIPCTTSRGLWLAFVAESSVGVAVAAGPARNKKLSWSEIPWRGGGYGWWMLCEGFSRPFSALVYDGLLYLLGWEGGHKELKIIDLTPGKLVAASEVDDSAQVLAVSDGQAVLLGTDGQIVSVSDLSDEAGSIKKGILYTLNSLAD